MRRHRLLSLALTPCLAVLTLLPTTDAEAAKRILLENASSRRISTALVLRTYNGWRVVGWYALPPWSYKRLNFSDAGGSYFGIYARAGSIQWAGARNQPLIAIVDNRMNHGVRQQPYGRNRKLVRVRMINGNSLRYTWSGDQQRRKQPQNNGWW